MCDLYRAYASTGAYLLPQRDRLGAITIPHVIAAHLAGGEGTLRDVLRRRRMVVSRWVVYPTIWVMMAQWWYKWSQRMYQNSVTIHSSPIA